MPPHTVTPSDDEITFGAEEIIVSKTNLDGQLTYVNATFCRVSEMTTKELIGAPHDVIWHPDMPKAIFNMISDTISKGNELFAYVKNISKTGKYFWVMAHVTPTYSQTGTLTGYHSCRRKPLPNVLPLIQSLYGMLLAAEKRCINGEEELVAGSLKLAHFLEDKGQTYDEFIWSLGGDNV